MLETAFSVVCFLAIVVVIVLLIDYLRELTARLARDFIDIRQKWEISNIQVEEKRLELEKKYDNFQ